VAKQSISQASTSKTIIAMSTIAQRSNGIAGVDGGENLILTPSKLRLYSYVFGPYVTCLWLPNSLFAALLLWKVSNIAGYCLAAQVFYAAALRLTRLVLDPAADCLCWPSGMVDSLPAPLDWAWWSSAAGAECAAECGRLHTAP
jgi:hypothetical protein